MILKHCLEGFFINETFNQGVEVPCRTISNVSIFICFLHSIRSHFTRCFLFLFVWSKSDLFDTVQHEKTKLKRYVDHEIIAIINYKILAQKARCVVFLLGSALFNCSTFLYLFFGIKIVHSDGTTRTLLLFAMVANKIFRENIW